MNKKRLFATFSVVFILIIALTSIFPASAETPVEVSSSGHDTPLQVWEPDDTLGMRIYITAEFNAVSFLMPTWSTSGVYSTTISAYKWEKDYEHTVLTQPIFEKRYTELQDNAENVLRFSSPQPAGEYLFLIHDSAGNVGCWAKNGNESNSVTYQDGAEVDYCLRAYVYFSGNAPAEPFGQGLSPTEVYGVAPKYPEITQSVRDISSLNLPESSLFNSNFCTSDLFSLKNTDLPQFDAQKQVALLLDGVFDEDTCKALSLLKLDAVLFRFTSIDDCLKIFELWQAQQRNGVDVPKIAFYFSTSVSMVTLRTFYLNLYRDGKFNSVWYYFDGKPLLVCNDRYFNVYKPIEKEITDFFTFKNFSDSKWQLSSDYPQEIYYDGNAEQMSVNATGNLQKQFDYANEINTEILVIFGENLNSNFGVLKEYVYKYKGVNYHTYSTLITDIDLNNASEWCNIPYYAFCQFDGCPIGIQVAFDKNYVYILSEFANFASRDLKVKIIVNSDEFVIDKSNSEVITDGRFLIFKANRSIIGTEYKENCKFDIKFAGIFGDVQLPGNDIYYVMKVTDGQIINEETSAIPEAIAETSIQIYTDTEISDEPQSGCNSEINLIPVVIILICFIYICGFGKKTFN